MAISSKINYHWNRLNLLKNRGGLIASDKLTMMLNIGLDLLNMDMGIISQITGKQYVIELCTNPQYVCQEWDLSQTFCDLTIHYNGLVDLERILPEFQRHPAYSAFPIASYIGIPFTVYGQTYGTIAYVKADAHRKDFTQDEADFMSMLAQMVTNTFEQTHVR